MEKIKAVLLSFLVVSVMGFLTATPALSSDDIEACTAGGIGKDATVDGSVLTFQSADCGYCDPRLLYVPAADHRKHDRRVLRYVPQASGGGPIEDVIEDSPYSIPQVKHTYAYFKGVFGHMNEHQLGISESTRGGAWALNNPEGVFCVTELSMIALERCTTAREAIKLMGELAEQYGFHGFSTGEMLFVADPEEVWIWEIYRPGPDWSPDPATGMDPTGRLGCAWVAQRIPDNHICVMPNLPRIAEIDLSDEDNFMASDNIFSLGEELGLWTGGPYDMREVYGRNMRASARLWNLCRILAPSQFGDMDFSNDLRDYPFSFEPDEKLSVLDLAELFRNSGEGTEFDNTVGVCAGPWGNPQHYGATRLAPTPRTEYTDITQSRGWLPDPIGGILWWGVDNGHTSVFVPLYAGITELPESYTIGDHYVFTRDSAWWAFNFVNNWATINWKGMYPIIRTLRDELEAAQMTIQPIIDYEALKLYGKWSKKDKKDKKHKKHKKACTYLTAYCVDNADYVVSAWWELADYLMSTFDDGRYPRYIDGERLRPNQEWLDVCY